MLVVSLSFHEAAHAWTADRLGDPTARLLGRLTLNPLAHIDWIGTVLFPLVAMFSGAAADRLGEAGAGEHARICERRGATSRSSRLAGPGQQSDPGRRRGALVRMVVAGGSSAASSVRRSAAFLVMAVRHRTCCSRCST